MKQLANTKRSISKNILNKSDMQVEIYIIQVVVLASLAQLLGCVELARFARSIATDKKCLYVFCMEHFACS